MRHDGPHPRCRSRNSTGSGAGRYERAGHCQSDWIGSACRPLAERHDPVAEVEQDAAGDRRADIDRGWVYHMGLLPSPAIDAAWGVLLDAVARDVAYDHVGAARGSPLLALRKAGVDRGSIKSGN
jgi:hypothetical protein